MTRNQKKRAQGALPTVCVGTDDIPTDFDRRYLGHIEVATMTSDIDLRTKLRKSSVDFHKVDGGSHTTASRSG